MTVAGKRGYRVSQGLPWGLPPTRPRTARCRFSRSLTGRRRTGRPASAAVAIRIEQPAGASQHRGCFGRQYYMELAKITGRNEANIHRLV
jgi:hypothetical protein